MINKVILMYKNYSENYLSFFIKLSKSMQQKSKSTLGHKIYWNISSETFVR